MKHFIVLAVIAIVGCTLVQGSVLSRRDVKADLIKKGQDLLKKADAEIKKLSADAKQAVEVNVLKTEEARIKKLVADLEAATETATITKLERELNTAENKLAYEIKKIETKTVLPISPAIPVVNTKAALLKRAQTLEKQAEELIKKLTEEKKDTEVAELKKDEAIVKKLVSELSAAEAADLVKIERELIAAEAKLSREIKKDTPAPSKRDVKADLIKKGQDLLKKADAEIKKLSADAKQAVEVNVLKTEEARIKKLVADLEAATETATITKLERELNTAENKLAYEIKKIETKSPAIPILPAISPKAALLKRAQTLEKQAEELIKKLTEEKKDTEVAELKKDEAAVKKLVSELSSAEAADLVKIEKELAAAEAKLAREIKKDTPTSA